MSNMEGRMRMTEKSTGGVTRAEMFQFGPYATLVRQLGRLAEQAERAGAEARAILESSRDADNITEVDGQPTEHSRWAGQVAQDIEAIEGLTQITLRAVSRQTMDRWEKGRMIEVPS